MPLPPLELPIAARVPARLAGGPVPNPTSGYRDWAGWVEASQPIVSLVINVAGSQASWARTSHRGKEALESRITFSPNDSEGLRICVSFGILDAVTYCQTRVASHLMQPAPLLKEFTTGELVEIADIPSDPPCELKAIFPTRTDVKSVRNGVWHLRGRLAATLAEPWHTILTYGRAGELKLES